MSWCETEMQKYMPLVKQNVMKFEVFILEDKELIRKEIRDGGEGVERGLSVRKFYTRPSNRNVAATRASILTPSIKSTELMFNLC